MEIVQIFYEAVLNFLLLFALGNILSFPFQIRSNPIQKVFFKLFLGVIGTIIFTSIYFTSFKTINSLLIPIGGYMLFTHGSFSLNRFHLSDFLIELKYLFIPLVVLLITIVIQFYRLDYFNNEITYLSPSDFSYYTTISEYLLKTGVERIVPWYELNELSAKGKVGPYHYGELWFLGSMILYSKIASLKVFLYIFIPICVTVSFSGLYALVVTQESKLQNISILIICFLMVFSMGNIPFYRIGFGFQPSPLTSPKVFLFFIHITLAFIFLLKNRFVLFVLAISIIPIFHILYAPMIFTGVFLWSCFLLYKKREKKYLAGIYLPTLIAFGILLFYYFFGEISSSFGGTQRVVFSNYIRDFFITIFRNIIARSVMFYVPFLLIMFFVWKIRNRLLDEEKMVFIFLFFLVISILFFRGLLSFNKEANQIHHITFNPLVTNIFILSLGIFYRVNELKLIRQIYFLIAFQGIASFYIILNKYPQRENYIHYDTLNNIKIELANVNPIGVFISSPSVEKNHWNISTSLCPFATPLKLVGKNFWVNSLSVPENLENLEFLERVSDISNSPFYRFIQKQKKEQKFTNYNKAQVDFIMENNIEYILLEENTKLPDELKKITTKVIGNRNTEIKIGILQY